MPDRKTVMISSTARDLPEHRKEAMDACLRQGMFPMMMEHLPASDDEAISASLEMVDRGRHLRRHLRASLRLRAGGARDLRHRDGVQPGGRAQDPAPDLRDGQGPPDHDRPGGDGRRRESSSKRSRSGSRPTTSSTSSNRPPTCAPRSSTASRNSANPTSPRSTTSATSPRRPRRTSRTRTPSCRRTGWSAGRRSSIC